MKHAGNLEDVVVGNGISAVSERLLTLEELCEKLGGVRPWTIRAWVSQRKIPYTKVGRLTRFPESLINGWIETHTCAPINS